MPQPVTTPYRNPEPQNVYSNQNTNLCPQLLVHYSLPMNTTPNHDSPRILLEC